MNNEYPIFNVLRRYRPRHGRKHPSRPQTLENPQQKGGKVALLPLSARQGEVNTTKTRQHLAWQMLQCKAIQKTVKGFISENDLVNDLDE